jgi:antitoxin CptB
MNDDISRLRWQCRRGMRELDQLLSRYLDEAYAGSDAAEKAAFRDLLTLPDPELAGYFLGRQRPEDPAIAAIVERILERA